MSRVVAIAALCLFLAGCQDGLGSTSAEWENWERHSVDVATVESVDDQFGNAPLATFGAELSLPEEFAHNYMFPGTSAVFVAGEDHLNQDQTITVVRVGTRAGGLTRAVLSDMEPVSIGEREYSGYREMSASNDGSARVDITYLAGGQWWILQASSVADSLTDFDEELLDNIIDSIDHG